jgi:hypothetical protein
MDDFNLSVRIDDSRSICIAPLPARTYREAGAKGLGGEYGYFIFEVDETLPEAGINVIGKAASPEAALRLFDLLVEKRA